MIQRKIARIVSSHLHPGFLGEGHLAAPVVDGNDFARTDPFILLMDDQLDLPGGPPVGGAHPHAGFETVTLVLQGNERDWETGSIELMTAGRGIVHTEEITTRTKMRILQLWLVLPPEKRWTEPLFQQILLEDVPTLKTGDNEIRVYSGSSNGLISPLQNYAPFTLVDFKLGRHAETNQEIPVAYNGFIYVIEGEVWVSDTKLEPGQVGWFDKFDQPGNSHITFKTTAQEARFVLYAGQPQKAPIVTHGPFIGNTREDITRLYQEYRQGKMPHLSTLSDARKIKYTRAGNMAHSTRENRN